MRTAKPSFLFSDEEYGFQLLRTIGAASVGAAEVGECLATASLIKEGDDESWYSAWRLRADSLMAEGSLSKSLGHDVSAASAFARASNYYRAAEFFLHTNKNDPRILETWQKSKQCFQEVMTLSDTHVKKVSIPFEGTSLPGYLCLANHEKGPLLIVQTGFDGTMEELYFGVAKEATKRGIHCLVFEGPGQGGVLREQHIPFRPNWETVITPVIDYAEGLPAIDKSRIALLGISMGGYLVPRALAFEKRIKTGIVNGGILDFHELCTKGNVDLDKGLDDEATAKEIDRTIFELMKTNSTIRWVFGHGMYAFHADSPSEWLKKTRAYQLHELASKISCHMLVIDSESDSLTAGQSKKFYDTLVTPKDFLLFTEAEGAGDHCQVGSPIHSSEKVFNWLEGQWKGQPPGR